jgi:hypothetical protein
MQVIDTRRNSRAGGVSKAVSERKYICEPCAKELGQAVGLVPAEDHSRTVEALATSERLGLQLERDLSEARSQQSRVVNADEIADVVSETIRAELAKSVKKASVKPAAKPSAS